MARAAPTKAGSPERQQLADKVLEGMRKGKSAHLACEAIGLAQSTFATWVSEDAQLAEQYARAREDLIERMAAETLAIADAPVGSTESGATDNGAVQKQRLQVDTRKWLLSKLAPKKYGDQLTLTGDSKAPISVSWRAPV